MFLIINATRPINNFAKILCLVILIMCGIAFIFMLIAWIILIVDYALLQNDLDDLGLGLKIPSKEWAAAFVPSLITLIALLVMALAANFLYKIFLNRMNTTPYPVNIPNNSMHTIPNIPPSEIIPNMNGPVPPMGNNVPFPVPVQQSVVNINK